MKDITIFNTGDFKALKPENTWPKSKQYCSLFNIPSFLLGYPWNLTKTYSLEACSIQYWWEISVSTKKLLWSLSCSVASITANSLCTAAHRRATAKHYQVRVLKWAHKSLLVLTRYCSLDYQECHASVFMVLSFVEVSNHFVTTHISTFVFKIWQSHGIL